MSRLVLVRHAQASFGSAEYDRLSTVGEEQARRLGTHWAGQGMVFDQVFVGPRRRHQHTAELVGEAVTQAGLPWPESVSLPELDEYAGLEVFRAALPQLATAGLDAATLSKAVKFPPATFPVELLKVFQDIMARWVRGELSVPGVETWPEFRRRARRGLDKVLDDTEHDRRIAVFTSTGPVAAALDRAFGLDDERMIEASWQLRNTSVSEFLFSTPRFSMSTFNALPHLTTARLVTHI
jgi:broad specificity phosphatase PhoE